LNSFRKLSGLARPDHVLTVCYRTIFGFPFATRAPAVWNRSVDIGTVPPPVPGSPCKSRSRARISTSDHGRPPQRLAAEPAYFRISCGRCRYRRGPIALLRPTKMRPIGQLRQLLGKPVLNSLVLQSRGARRLSLRREPSREGRAHAQGPSETVPSQQFRNSQGQQR
jgi:hypothetical protein